MAEHAVRAIDCQRQRKNKHQSLPFWARVVAAGFLVTLAFLILPIHPALADTPAVTDFGAANGTVQDAWQEAQHASHYAMFLTLYEDGRRQVDVKPIGSDEVVSFRTNHPSWELCPELMWFVNMPVYIKEIPEGTDVAAV